MSDISEYLLLSEEESRYDEPDGSVRFNNKKSLRQEQRDKHNKLMHKWNILRLFYNEYCPVCSSRNITSKMIGRESKYGKFEGCSRFPNCRYTQESKEKYKVIEDK